MNDTTTRYLSALAQSIIQWTELVRRLGNKPDDPFHHRVAGLEHAYVIGTMYLEQDSSLLGLSSELILSDACERANACPDCLSIGSCPPTCDRMRDKVTP